MRHDTRVSDSHPKPRSGIRPIWRHGWVVLVLLSAGGCASSQAEARQRGHDHAVSGTPATASNDGLAVPAAIRTEHEHLHHQLAAAVASGGTTAAKAEAVAAVLHAHFQNEDAYAMPPLGLLGPLARNEPVPDEQVRQAIEMADRLRVEYDKMLKEHEALTRALRELAAAAKREGKPEHAAFAEALMAHAQNEEQILYPTTLLIGEYLKLRHRGGH